MPESRNTKFAVVTGATRISRLQAWTLSMAFIFGLAVVPLIDLPGGVGGELKRAGMRVVDGARQEWKNDGRWLALNRLLEGEMRSIESMVADHSFMAHHARPALLGWLLEAGAGNENVYPGKDGWLFYRPEIDFLTARSFVRGPDSPEAAMASLAADLAGRGIALVLMPVPGKPQIHPEMFATGSWEDMPRSADWRKFQVRLSVAIGEEYARRGLDGPFPVLADAAEMLWQRKNDGAQFLATDSHWTAEAVGAAADFVAEQLAGMDLSEGSDTSFLSEPAEVSGCGDTALMLGLPQGSRWNVEETVEVRRIRMADGSRWQPDPSSPVLLMGDSFTNIYSQDELGWGSGAGLAEQLSVRLGRAVDRICRNDSGASATREMLASELMRNPMRLEGKKVVIWQFAMRELVVGDWKKISLPEAGTGPNGTPDFLVLNSGETRTFHGRIKAMGELPRVGQTPYKDYLTAFHLEEVGGTAQTVIYLQTLRDRELTDAARLAPGQNISVNMSSWVDAEEAFGSMNRGDLDDGSLLLQEPNFGILEP